VPKAGDVVIADTRLRTLYSYWREKRGGRAMPARLDIEPTEIPTLLPIVGLTDVVDGGARFRYRLLGTEIVEMTGTDPTGRYLDEGLPDGGYADYLIGLFREVAEARRALYGESDLPGGDRIERQVRRLLLPLSSDGQAVDMILGGQVSAAKGGGAGPRGAEGSGPFHEVVRVLLD
jgi:hypothetical protein